MSSKFCFIIIPMTLDDVYDSIKEYMITNRGNIIKEQVSTDSSIKTLIVQRGMSFTSNGEQYVVNLKFNEYDDCTYIAIEISLSFGYGMQWLNPLKLINQLARQVNYLGEVNLVRKGELDIFFEFKPKKPKSIKPVLEASPKLEEVEIKTTKPFLESSPKPEEIEIKTPKPVVSLNPWPYPSRKKVNFCTNCGAELNETQKFCINCGYKIRD